MIMAPYRWVEQIEAELEAGAWKVVTEARETGTAGIYRADGEVRMGLIDEIAHAVDFHRLLFEAPRKDQQVWFLRRFGPEVNLGNIAPGRRAVAGDAAPRAALRHGGAAGTSAAVTILLARHGETDDNREPIRIQGSRDTPLNDTGRAQAAELAARMRGRGAARPCTPATSRARARRPRSSGARLGLDAGRRSSSGRGRPRRAGGPAVAGRGRGRSPSVYAAWRAAGEEFRFPGGESLREQSDRVHAALDDVRAAGAPAGARGLPRRARFAWCSAPGRVVAWAPSTTGACPTWRRSGCERPTPLHHPPRAVSGATATRSASLVFAALVAASAGAFLVTQRLKQAPRLVRTLTVTPAISPNVPYRRASIRLRLERADRATISMVDADGDAVRRLLTDRPSGPRDKLELLWNGRDDRGRVGGRRRVPHPREPAPPGPRGRPAGHGACRRHAAAADRARGAARTALSGSLRVPAARRRAGPLPGDGHVAAHGAPVPVPDRRTASPCSCAACRRASAATREGTWDGRVDGRAARRPASTRSWPRTPTRSATSPSRSRSRGERKGDPAAGRGRDGAAAWPPRRRSAATRAGPALHGVRGRPRQGVALAGCTASGRRGRSRAGAGAGRLLRLRAPRGPVRRLRASSWPAARTARRRSSRCRRRAAVALPRRPARRLLAGAQQRRRRRRRPRGQPRARRPAPAGPAARRGRRSRSASPPTRSRSCACSTARSSATTSRPT